MFTPVNPRFTMEKWGIRGSKLYRYVYVMKFSIVGYPKCAQLRLWSACAYAQADLNLYWFHVSKGTVSEVAGHLIAHIIDFKICLEAFNAC